MERWIDVPGYSGRYQVSDLGNVKNYRGKKLKPFDRIKTGPDSGYMSIHLVLEKNEYKNFTLHSLVMLAFVGQRPDGHVINHINGNKSDNRLLNLEYCTQSHNRKEDFLKGRQSLLGEKNTKAKLDKTQVLEIVRLREAAGYRYADLAEMFNMTSSGISSIFNGYTWSHITGIKKPKQHESL